MSFNMVILLLIVLIGLKTSVIGAQSIGICYGRVANNLPPAKEVIDLYKSNGIERMRIYDPFQVTLEALRKSNIELVIGVPNEDIKSIANIGGANLEVVISESGWPSHGDVAASVENAQIYYENLIKHVSNGTISRPNQALETYLFAMFDENKKGPAETERHYGLFTPNKQLKYQISQLLMSSNSTTPQPEEGRISSNSTTPQSEEGGILSMCFSLLFLYFI
ncbi:putative glucan endo-1,3-beta-D-glucosidase [Medicago truncatula]|uniref:glucan endo-1,3-beta-D-glucosidase n=1 Tax=Medicago truncatula TaxID=3880 RepID=A0A396IAI7_MEDTR|nr:putative glucan endo-1,3-beta-D-glucosidase [Medicago truncatula]